MILYQLMYPSRSHISRQGPFENCRKNWQTFFGAFVSERSRWTFYPFKRFESWTVHEVIRFSSVFNIPYRQALCIIPYLTTLHLPVDQGGSTLNSSSFSPEEDRVVQAPSPTDSMFGRLPGSVVVLVALHNHANFDSSPTP
ncbi:hypothetical protein H2248_012263 [Termitomyces sp. 'cryptogamus']|nr:hypothetical protein H2248_012263 [Termitomyces sp. 'cryptogamus']